MSDGSASFETSVKLSNITITEEDLDELRHDLDVIMALIAPLTQIEAEDQGVSSGDTVHQFRADVVLPSLSRESVLQNAPQQEAGCVVVPRVIE